MVAVNSRNTSADDLADIVARYPGLGAEVARHPAAYPELLEWLTRYGNPDAMVAAKQVLMAGSGVVSADAASASQAPQAWQARSPRQASGSGLRRVVLGFVAVLVVALVLVLAFGLPGTGFHGLVRPGTPTGQPTVVVTSHQPQSQAISPAQSSVSTPSSSQASVPAQTTPANSPKVAWATYTNPRYKFSVDYPKVLTPNPPPANGDGQSWHGDQGNVDLVVAGHNVMTNAQDEVAAGVAAAKQPGDKITYQDGGVSRGHNWGIVSGLRNGGAASFYTYIACGTGSCVTMAWTWDTSATDVKDWITQSYHSLKLNGLDSAQ